MVITVGVYPVNLNLKARRCAVIGGGVVAERKVETLLAAEAEVTVFSPTLTNNLSKWAETELLSAYLRAYKPGELADFFLVICATNDATVNRLAAQEAKEAKALVNVVDAPELCDFTVPAQVKRNDLLLTVSTGGHSPKFARLVKEQLAAEYGEEYGIYLELLGQIRCDLKQENLSSKERCSFWQKCLDKEVLALLKAGEIKRAEEKIRYAACCIGTQS
ncbi:MAG: bifunctional precorrin-2 dehydrogenase/sirohydrochlorin ferrochelatase [Sporomusaceae bacterium]|nr:bifunctional precorrin-2 dehydrogenase/sirohydrochlorin ferrochelatase [Sporomusaceae bacterium]